MAIRQRIRKSKKPRRFYGFVENTTAGTESKYARQSFILDCVDADAFDANPDSIRDPNALAIVRTLSTPRRWRDDVGLLARTGETDWVELTVAAERGQPRAWVMPAQNDFNPEIAENVTNMRRLPDEAEVAGDSVELEKARTLRSVCRLQDGERKEAPGLLETILLMDSAEPLEIRVVDVGQAHCIVFLSKKKPVGYFDVGAPLGMNKKSFHGRLCHSPPGSGFVILSHWDFDHFDLARRVPGLCKLKWFAPDQPVGPNTLRFQRKLGNNLNFIQGPIDAGVPFLLRPGLATDPKDRNGTGYSLRYNTPSGEIVVLTGDTDYSLVDPVVLNGATAILIPHHGGKGTSPPIPVTGLKRAVASYGVPNRYKHPVESFLEEHEHAKWQVLRTASHSATNTRRGSRVLYP